MMNVKAISVNVGKALLVSALFMFLSIAVSVIDGRDEAFGPLLISFIITLLVGSFPFIFVRGKQPSDELIELAGEYDIALLSTELTLYIASGTLYTSGLMAG